MQNHRISTTISQKHWELLNKHAEKYETQQKALERALECLENSSKQSAAMTEEERYWNCLKSTKTACFIQKDGLKMLIDTADVGLFTEYAARHKPIEYTIEYYFQKPLKEISLKEVINGLVLITNISNWFDSVDCIDDNGHYTIILTHSLGLNASRINLMTFESLFKTCGARVDSTISERMIFMKIFKT